MTATAERQNPWLAFNSGIVHTAEPEDALDAILEWLDCELLDGSEYVTLRATTADVDPADYGWPSDPLWVNGNDRIVKRVEVGELAETRKRWALLGRAISQVTIW